MYIISSGGGKLTQVPQDFYMKAFELIGRLNKLIRETPSQAILRDREVAERNLIDIAEARLAKILKLTYSGGEEFRDKMTPEERIIYNHLVEVLESWRSHVKSSIAGAGSVER
jgi:DNA replication initiation complex subunit (GINS family)